jgi:hypothetical protein
MPQNATQQGNATYGGVPLFVSPVSGAGGAAVSTPGYPGVQAVATESLKATYSYATASITPAATPTELFNISGATGKVIRIKKIAMDLSSTVSGKINVALIKRSTAASGGTSASGSVNKFDSSDVTASASILSFTGNPTVGTTTSIAEVFAVPSAANPVPVVRDYSTRNDESMVLRVGEYLGINGLGSALPNADARINFTIEWTEESSTS